MPNLLYVMCDIPTNNVHLFICSELSECGQLLVDLIKKLIISDYYTVREHHSADEDGSSPKSMTFYSSRIYKHHQEIYLVYNFMWNKILTQC